MSTCQAAKKRIQMSRWTCSLRTSVPSMSSSTASAAPAFRSPRTTHLPVGIARREPAVYDTCDRPHRRPRGGGAPALAVARTEEPRMPTTSVLAPVAGRAVPMEQVPDPVFAQLMTGPGAAVDPPRAVVDVVAPVDGKVFKLFPHAFIILTGEGVAVLVHLGLDTVQLNGEGFTTHVREGDAVTAGQ